MELQNKTKQNKKPNKQTKKPHKNLNRLQVKVWNTEKSQTWSFKKI